MLIILIPYGNKNLVASGSVDNIQKFGTDHLGLNWIILLLTVFFLDLVGKQDTLEGLSQ